MTTNIAHSTREARKRLGDIGHTTFYKLVNERKIRVRKLAGRTVVLDSDLNEYLASLPDATEIGAVRAKQPAESVRP